MGMSFVSRIQLFLLLMLGINAVIGAENHAEKERKLYDLSNNSNNLNESSKLYFNRNVTARVRYIIGGTEKKAITILLNNLRRNIVPIPESMKTMTWDQNLENAMQIYIDSVDPTKLYEYDPRFPDPYPGFYNNVLLFHVMEVPELEYYRKVRKCGYFMHDTFASNNDRAVLNIFRFRLVQKDLCYRYSMCDRDEYQNYKTCNKVKDAPPGSRCAGAGRYIGDFLNQAQGAYACVVLNTRGTATPDPERQDNAFLCSSCYEDIDWVQKNDVPYESGTKRASNCGIFPQYNRSFNGLCAKPINTNRKSGNVLRL